MAWRRPAVYGTWSHQSLRLNSAVVAMDQRGHGESDKPDRGYDFAAVAQDLHGFVQALGLARPVVVGHSWGGDVALEFAVSHPGVPNGLCFVDGGTIEISSRPDMTLERAKQEMAPPDFTGVTLEQLRERARSWLPETSVNPQLEEIRLANFELLEDNTLRARLSRDNHMRIIEAFWTHRPSLLYPNVECPVLLMPARPKGDDPLAGPWLQERRGHRRCCNAFAQQQDRVARGQHSRRPTAAA